MASGSKFFAWKSPSKPGCVGLLSTDSWVLGWPTGGKGRYKLPRTMVICSHPNCHQTVKEYLKWRYQKPISYNMCTAYVMKTDPQNDQKSGSGFLHFTGLQNLALNQAAKPLKPIFRSIGTICGLCFPKMYSIGDKSATLRLKLLVFHCSSNFFLPSPSHVSWAANSTQHERVQQKMGRPHGRAEWTKNMGI